MKKLLLSLTLIFTSVTITNAQETKFGIKGALNLATITAEDTEIKVGGAFGGFVEIKISDKFAIQPEITYSIQGANAKSVDAGFDVNYINIPVMAKFFVTEKFSLELGPQIGFVTSAKARYEKLSADAKNFINSTDFGINFGMAFDVSENVNIGFRYNAGLSEVLKNIPDGENAGKNSVIQLGLGYKF